MALPQDIVVFAIEVKDVTTFREGCTPEVRKAIPIVVDMVIRELGVTPVLKLLCSLVKTRGSLANRGIVVTKAPSYSRGML